MEYSAINGIADRSWLNKLDVSNLKLNSCYWKKNPVTLFVNFKMRFVG
jgi:hypothetical protein